MRTAVRAVVTLVAVSVALFTICQLLPGDAATAALGADATPEALERVRHGLGLDVDPVTRYGHWLAGLVTGDLGTSTATGRAVADVVAEPLAATLLLVLCTAVLAGALSLLLGVVAGTATEGRRDGVVSGLLAAMVSVPPFVVASLLAVGVATLLPVLPVVATGGAADLVLPALALTVSAVAITARTVRAAVADAVELPHVDAAVLAGLAQAKVVRRHVLPVVWSQCAQAGATMVTLLLGGAVLVERVFAYPGTGQVLVDAVRDHDAPVLEAVGMAFAVVVVAVQTGAGAVARRQR